MQVAHSGGSSGRSNNVAANWKRTVGSLRKMADKLRKRGFIVIEPMGFEIPPDRRIAKSSPPE